MKNLPGITLRSTKKRTGGLFLILIIISLLMVACGDPTATTVPATTAPTTTASTTTAAASKTTAATTAAANTTTSASTAAAAPACDKNTGFTLYAAISHDSVAAKAFQQQTGIAVKLVDDSTGPLLAKVAAESNNPQWDAIWFDGDVTMRSLDQQGLLLKWDSTALNSYNELGKPLVPGNHAYYPVGITAAGSIVYNLNNIPAAGLPKDWNDLLNPAYKNLVAENDPAFSGPAFPFIAGIYQIMGGESQGQSFFTKLKANGVQIFQTNKPTLNSVVTGAREFAIIQDSAYYAAKKAGQPLGIIYPSSGVVAMGSAIGISSKAQHSGCAQQFVNWLLSSEGQTVAVNADPNNGDTYFIPIINGVKPVVQRATAADGVKFVYLETDKYAQQATQIKQWFHDNLVQ